MAERQISSISGNPRRATHQEVRERWVIRGTLVLETPAHFGANEPDDVLDMPVLLDESDGEPLLPGASIAGALRNYLREIESGDGFPLPSRPSSQEEPDKDEAERILKRRQTAERKLAATLLFGGFRGDDDGEQSPLIVYDARGRATGYEVRDGVAIDRKTRTAEDDKKFDIQLLAAGSAFDLCFELVGRTPRRPAGAVEWDAERAYQEHRSKLLNALTTTLNGLAQGEITLGARKRRGFGCCSVKSWTVQHYDMTQREHLLAWLRSGRHEDNTWYPLVEAMTHTDIAAALAESIEPLADRRKRTALTATFALDSSLLIRSGFGGTDTGADMVHLHSRRDNGSIPIIPGTSWAGILRHRAEQIANTLARPGANVQTFLDGIFGPAEIAKETKYARASRLSVAETTVNGGRSLVQTRVKIDRFTGGAFEEALFSEQPLFGDENTYVTLNLTLRPEPPSPEKEDANDRARAEFGLLLLLLKDLWTGDLRIGGESSVGRGRLRGREATLTIGDGRTWRIQGGNGGKLSIEGNRQELEQYVTALTHVLTGG